MNRTIVPAIAVIALLASCTKTESRLEQLSREAEEKEAVEVAAMAKRLPTLPETSELPVGVPAGVWEDLHWLPPTVVGINGTADQMPFVAQWVFSQAFAEHESCRALERGFEGGYGIEWEQQPQSFVFFGRAELADVDACAQAFARDLGGAARLETGVLTLGLQGRETQVQLGRRGEQLIAIVDDGRIGTIAGDRLGDNANLLSLLRTVDTSRAIWSMSARDVTSVPLGVPSLGFIVYAAAAAEPWEFRFTFGSETDAEAALQATDPAVQKAETNLGVSLEVSAELEGSTLVASVDLMNVFSRPPEELEALQQKLDAMLAGRG